ncbi:hypothetical protein AMJ85_07935, partial [candidate division BRC1 bacterium SM23_51]
MSNSADSKKIPLVWLRANLKTILLALNALVLVVLLYSVISWTFFEIRTRRLLATAAEIKTSEKKTEQPKDTRGAPVAKPGPPSERERTTATATAKPTSAPTSPTTSRTATGDRPSSPT